MITLDELGQFTCQRCAHRSIRHWELLWGCLDCEVKCTQFEPRFSDEGLIDELLNGTMDELLGHLGGWE